MSSLRRRLSLCVAVAFTVVLVGNIGQALAQSKPKVINWTMQLAYPSITAVSMFGLQWVKAMEKMTNGRLKIKVVEPGTFCGPGDLIGFLEKGVFDVGNGFAAYYAGIIPECDLEAGLPLAHRELWELYEALYELGLADVINEGYAKHNIVSWPCPSNCFYSYMTNFPVKSIDDFKGKKIRAVGTWGEFTRAMGAAPTAVIPAELYMAMQLGTVDGALMGGTGMADFKYWEVAKYWVDPTFGHCAAGIWMNKNSLKALPDDIRTIVEEGTKHVTMTSALHYRVMERDARILMKQNKMQFVTLSEDEMSKALHLAMPIWDKIAAKSESCKRGVEIIKNQLQVLGRR